MALTSPPRSLFLSLFSVSVGFDHRLSLGVVMAEQEQVNSKMITYDQLAENFHLPINEV